MIRLSNPCEWLLLAPLLVLGCQRTHNLTFETAPLGSEPPRRAPAVAVDPAPALPEAEPQASAQAGFVVLRAPSAERPDQAVIQDFFQAVSERDSEKLEDLFQSGAKVKTSATSGGMDAIDFWKSRLSRLDYSKLAGQTIYRSHAIEVYRAEDLHRLEAERSVPVSVAEHQLAVRVPLHPPETIKARLFGDEIVFLLTPTDHGLRIAEMVEDFQLP